MRFRTLRVRKDPACPVCGANPAIRELIDYEAFCGFEPEQSLGAELEIEPRALRDRIDRGAEIILLDVREPQEWAIGRIKDAILIPLGNLSYRLGELSTADEIVAYCRSGSRSRKAVQALRDAGFRKIKNLTGGILAWSEQVDPSVPRY